MVAGGCWSVGEDKGEYLERSFFESIIKDFDYGVTTKVILK